MGSRTREIWLRDPDGYTVVVASPDGEAFEPNEPGGAADRRSRGPPEPSGRYLYFSAPCALCVGTGAFGARRPRNPRLRSSPC
jgi:hypothetical protein